MFIQGLTRLDLDVPHEPARTLQKARGIGQGSAKEEPDVHVGLVGSDIAEPNATDARGGTPIVQEFQDIWPSCS